VLPAGPGETMRGQDQPGGNRRGLLVSVGSVGVVVTSARKTAQADAASIGTGNTLRQAGHRMRELGVAALAVCGEDGQFQGIISRDMVVQSIAAGGDPKMVTVGEVACHAPTRSQTVRQAGPLPDAGNGAKDKLCQPLAITG
jgi:CBS domain-containing protein